MRSVKPLLTSFVLLALSCATAYADPPAKPNGDAPSDLAPLGGNGDNATSGPLAHANTPPIGGATQGGGGNPKESGPVDAQRTQGPGDPAKPVQPDNK